MSDLINFRSTPIYIYMASFHLLGHPLLIYNYLQLFYGVVNSEIYQNFNSNYLYINESTNLIF